MTLKHRLKHLEIEVGKNSKAAENAQHNAWLARFAAASPANRETLNVIATLYKAHPEGPQRNGPDWLWKQWLGVARKVASSH